MSFAMTPRLDAYLPPILRLQPEIGGLFTDHMDLVTLVRWRLTCKVNYDQTTGALRRTLLALVRPFVPFPLDLVNIVTQFRGLFGGEAALAFLLRDPLYKFENLEIYVTEYNFTALCDAILKNPPIQAAIESSAYKSSSRFFALRRLIAQTLTITMTNGKTIHVHRSYTSSAAAPLTRNPCTALSNFVTAYSFGCSHPLLTLGRRALLADQELRFLPPLDAATMNNLLAHRFSMAVSPSAWPEFRSAESRNATGRPPSEPSSPLFPVSTLRGFVAGDVEEAPTPPGPASVDDDFAFNFGLARAVYGEAAVVGHTGPDEEDGEPGAALHPHSSITSLVAPFGPDNSIPTVSDEDSTYVEDFGSRSQSPESSVVLRPTTSSSKGTSMGGDVEHRANVVTSKSFAACEIHTSADVSDPGVDLCAHDVPSTDSDREEYDCCGLVELSPTRDSPDLGSGSVARDISSISTGPRSTCDVDEHPEPTCLMPGDRVGPTLPPHRAGALAPLGVPDATGLETSTNSISSSSTDDLDVLPLVPPEIIADALSADDDDDAHSTTDTEVPLDGRDDTTASTSATSREQSTDDVVVRCWRHRYLCPSQGRYFGDRGSFVDFMDPLGGSEDFCVSNNIAPYGAMVVWRIMSTFDCEEGCEYFDNVLEEGVTSIPVMFKRDPYGELRDIVSDRYMPVPRGDRMSGRPRSRSM